MSNNEECWRPIAGYEGYFSVSNLGNVQSETRTVPHKRHGNVTYKGKLIVPSATVNRSSRQLVVTLTRSGKGKTFYVHRLVAAAFVDNPRGYECVVHSDGDWRNNRADNLEWTTSADTVKRAYDSGRAKGNIGEKNPSAKLSEADVREIRRLLQEGSYTQRRIAEMFGVVPMVVTKIKKGRTWTNVE